MAKDYNIVGAFQKIEEELIASMIRNMKKHKDWETEEGFEWTMWQAEQLDNLKKYRKNNNKKFIEYFSTIDEQIEVMLLKAYAAGNMDQEINILESLKKGFDPKIIPDKTKKFIKKYKGKNLKEIASELIFNGRKNKDVDIEAAFFKINDRKLNALISSTKKDFKKAETAMLRLADDKYRKIIFDAQVYANTGAGTYEKAVDMATKDFLSKGINCIEYKNGARVNIADYVSMAIRTANKRAYLQGEGAKRKEWGVTTVIVTKRGAGCPKCVPFQGRVYIDDVWSGGKAEDGPYQLISEAIAKGLYHPNCKDTHTTYFEGVSSEPSPPSKEEQQRAIEVYNIQQKQRYCERQANKYKNLEKESLDKDSAEKYKRKREEWEKQTELYKNILMRQDRNQGEFKELKIPMQKRFVQKLAKKYDLDIKGLTIKIQRNKELLSLPFLGSTDYDTIGRIDLFPNAFKDEEELIKTMIHEKCHVMQLRKHGKQYCQDNITLMEKQAYRYESIWYNIFKKRVK